MTAPLGSADPVGDALLAGGLAASAYVLDLNGALTAPGEFLQEMPWSLPSRLFKFPIEVCPHYPGAPRKLGLMHPLLSAHPFVRRVEAVMGFPMVPGGAPNDAGYTRTTLGQWWHAVDLISERWRELLDTRHFTTPEHIAGAVEFGLHYRAQRFGLRDAHAVMRAIGAEPPGDRHAVLRCFHRPSSAASEPKANGKRGTAAEQRSQRGRWPVNYAVSADGHARAWAAILGLKSGWLRHARSGYAEWTEAGRAAYDRQASKTVPLADSTAASPAKAAATPPRLGGRQFDLFA